MPISINNKNITAINCEGREIVRAHAGLSLVFSKQQDLYGGMDISSIADLVMFRDLINTGTCIWNGVSTNTYKGNPIATGGLGATWYVTTDIDMSSICGAGVGDWTPIGTSSRPFSGAIEGLGFAISNLYIGSSGTYRGFFGYTACPVIKDFNLIDAYVVSSGYSGLLIATMSVNTATTYFNPLIYNVKVSGAMSCVASKYHSLAIGRIIGNASRRAQIDTIEVLTGSSLSITTNSNYCSGICSNATYSDFTNCINRGNITAASYTAGCFADINYCTIYNSKNYGAISGTTASAGVCGRYMNQVNNTLEKIYNYGQITATEGFAGVVHTISKSGAAISIIDCHNRGDLVALANITHAAIVNTVTASTISVSYSTNDCICSGGSFNGLAAPQCDTLAHCTNAGTALTGYDHQYGIGNLKTTGVAQYCINSMHMSSTNGTLSGISAGGQLFENCENYGNLTAPNSTAYQAFGITQTLASNLIVRDSINAGNITGGGFAAGICRSPGIVTTIVEVSGCSNIGTISALQVAVGIGGNYVTNCTNNGDVILLTTSTTSNFSASGITALMSTNSSSATVFNIENCTNTGNITGTSGAGGILSYCYAAPTIINCTNTGVVTASVRAAGIWGGASRANGATISYCTNSGAVNGGSSGAGIISIFASANTQVNKCINTGAISGTTLAGGISAAGVIVSNCINEGSVTSANAYGIAYVSSISYCLNKGAIDGSTYASGIGYSGSLHLACLNVATVVSASTATPPYIGGVGAIKPTTATANFYDTTIAGSIGAYQTVDIGGEGEGRPTSNLLGNSLLGAGSGWTTDNWVFTAGEYPTPRMD